MLNKHRGSADGFRPSVGEPKENISRIRLRGDHPFCYAIDPLWTKDVCRKRNAGYAFMATASWL